MREHLAEAFNDDKIKDKSDLNIYVSNIDFKAYVKSNKKEKDYILKNLRYLYKKYVYDPAKAELKPTLKQRLRTSPLASPRSSQGVKKTIAKEK